MVVSGYASSNRPSSLISVVKYPGGAAGRSAVPNANGGNSGDGEGVEDIGYRDLNAFALGAMRELNREHRVSAEFEEIVVASDAGQAKDLGPDTGQRGLGFPRRGLRRRAAHRPRRRARAGNCGPACRSASSRRPPPARRPPGPGNSERRRFEDQDGCAGLRRRSCPLPCIDTRPGACRRRHPLSARDDDGFVDASVATPDLHASISPSSIRKPRIFT